MKQRFLSLVVAACSVGAVTFWTGGCKKQEPFEIIEAPKAPKLQRHWEVPEFTFIDQNGATVKKTDLLGKVWIADFFYTTCPGPCPMLSSRLSAIQSMMGDRGDVRLVSVSLDPEKDTPEVLKQYAERFSAGPKWLFLTGDKAATYTLVQTGFKLAISEERNNPEPITHSTKLVLIDRNGWVRGFYEGVGNDETEAVRLLADADQLRNEKP